MKHSWVAVLAVSVFVEPATAQETSPIEALLSSMRGTLSVVSQPTLNGGKLTGCTLVYDAIYQDWTYRGGRYLKVAGNVGFAAFDGNVGANLKVVVHEIDASTPQLRMTPSPPSRAYLVNDALATNLESLVRAAESDTPGALFSVFQFSPTFEMVTEGIARNVLTVAFNSRDGGTDMQLPLELDVVDVTNTGERKRSEKAKDSFLVCLTKLAESLK